MPDAPHNTDPVLTVLSRLERRVNEIAPVGVPRLLSIERTADCLDVSTDTVRRMLDRRELTYVQSRPGASKRIPLEELKRWIEAHTTRPIAQ